MPKVWIDKRHECIGIPTGFHDETLAQLWLYTDGTCTRASRIGQGEDERKLVEVTTKMLGTALFDILKDMEIEE
jgi:hypothetical protein